MRNITVTTDRDIFNIIRSYAETGIFNGLDNQDPYLIGSRSFIHKYGCVVLFTRDEGMHTCGWWKNPDFERCYHLSISFPGGKKQKIIEKILFGLFGYDAKLTWHEPPYSNQGQSAEVNHYRLFCNQYWEPIKPRKEVYSRDFIPEGWMSNTELNYSKRK